MAQLAENAENSLPNAENPEQGNICSSVQSALTAPAALASKIVALTQLEKLLILFVISYQDLKEEYGENDDLRKVLTGLSVEHRKLRIEIKSLIKTIKEQAQTSTKIIEEAERLLVDGKNISNFLLKIETMVKESQTNFEELKKKYDALIDKVKDVLSIAGAGYKRNERKADLVQEVGCVGRYVGVSIGGIISVIIVARMAFLSCLGALAFVALGLFGGGVAGWMVVEWPLAVYGNQYREQEKESKSHRRTSHDVVQILLETFEVLNDISQLLGRLKTPGISNTIRQEKNSHKEDDEDAAKNADFLIQVSLKFFKEACKELEKNCDCFLDFEGLLPISEKCNDENTTGKNKKDN